MSTTPGQLTLIRPTGTDTGIQRIAQVLKVAAGDGQLLIFNTARTAGLPNLLEDNIWIGNNDNQPISVTYSLDNLIDTNIVGATAGEVLTVDNSGNWINAPVSSKKTWSWGAASSANNTTNRFLSKYDGTFTNESPYVSFYDAQIVAISIATNGVETWTGEVYLNGISILGLASGGADSAFNNTITGATFSAGDEISFYCNGVAINNPSIEIMIEEL